MRFASLALTAIVLAAACGGASTTASPIAKATPTPTPEPTVSVADSSLGRILIAATNKMTLYTYTKDTADLSNCYDQCAANWPPFTITSDPIAGVGVTGKLATAARKDGQKQLTWNSKPLYFYNKDAKPGDTLGQNVGTVWFVVTNP
jgi:predicted lipoprotein with Yx(FWY)xxD motif